MTTEIYTDKYYEQIEELEKYAQLDASELGEDCLDLCRAAMVRNCVSEQFQKAVKKELISKLKYFKDHSRIVETETVTTRKKVDLEWDSY